MPAYNGIYFLVKLRIPFDVCVYTKIAIHCDFFPSVTSVYNSFNNHTCHMNFLPQPSITRNTKVLRGE